MAQQTLHPRSSRRLLAGAVLVLLVLGLLPVRMTAWAGWIGDLVKTIVAPVSHPAARIAHWLSPAAPRGAQPEQILRLERERDELERLYRLEREEVARLRALIANLQAGAALYPEAKVRQLVAPVIGSSSDRSSTVLRARAGRSSGVHRGSVATAAGVQLVGRVEDVAERVCEIVPLTDPGAGQIGGVIMIGSATQGPACLLRPTGEGTLRGPVEDTGGLTAGPELAPGMRVYLQDTTWPRAAQMLLIGEIESVEPAPNQPLRRMVTVRPTLRLDRVGEVVLRMTAGEGGGP